MRERLLRCFVRGRDTRWEALCIDLDIAVEGTSRQDAATKLEEAIVGYVAAASAEEPEQARRLLNRRAPWHVRASMSLDSAFHVLFRAREGGELRGSFDLACPG